MKNLLVFLNICIIFSATNAADFNVYVDTQNPVFAVDDRFLSVTLDTCNAESSDLFKNSSWYGLDFDFVTPLAKALSPAYFRFGGSQADHIVYQVPPSNEIAEYVLTAKQIDELYNFTKNSGLRLVFDLNLWNGWVDSNSTYWNSTNVVEILDYLEDKGYDVDFEFGNEPDLRNLTSKQVAEAYVILKGILSSRSFYKDTKLVGPAMASVEVVNKHFEFLKDYYPHGPNASLSECTNPKIMDALIPLFEQIKTLDFPHLWIGETSSFAGGGAPNLSDTFAAGFLWIDKLGLASKYGMEVVARQELHGCNQHNHPGSYGLLDYIENMRPNPDYYLSVLFKKLVGNRVYNLTVQPNNDMLRMYAASSLHTSGFVVYGSKLDNQSFNLDIPSLTNREVTLYVLNSNDPSNLRSKTSILNGKPNNWVSTFPGPNLEGEVTTLPTTIPGYSQFFIVASKEKATSCPSGWYQMSTNKNKCIKIVNNTQALFSSRFDCSTYGVNSSILSIDSAFENAEIQKQTASSGCVQFYLGLIRSDNSWTWTNNDTSGYRNWASGYPLDDKTKNCVHIMGNSGTWMNSNCDELKCYICQQLF